MYGTMKIVLFFILLGIMGYIIYGQVSENLLHETDPMLEVLRLRLINLHPVVRNLKLYKGSKSYTLNKNKIFICLKDENGEYYDINSLTHVLIHEISHKINNEIGHTDKFKNIFDDLLLRATKLKVYDPNMPFVQSYCEY
jgi:hypothetical protein